MNKYQLEYTWGVGDDYTTVVWFGASEDHCETKARQMGVTYYTISHRG